MARTRRTYSDIITDVRRKLNEPTASESFWTDADLLQYLQEAKDLREAELLGHHEGYNTKIFKADLVAGQRSYELPEEVTVVQRVWSTQVGEKVLLDEDRQHYGSYELDSVQGVTTSFRLSDNHILLHPTPSDSTTDGLIIEADISDDRVTLQGKLPDSWPPQLESLLTFDTAIAAIEMQGVAADVENSALAPLIRSQRRLETAITDMIYRRSHNVITGPWFDWGT